MAPKSKSSANNKSKKQDSSKPKYDYGPGTCKQGSRNIDLLTIRHYDFPVQAVISILHRISGIVMFFLIPLVIWALELSLKSASSFAQVSQIFNGHIVKFIAWAFLSMLIYHMCAGIRHLIMDMGFAEEKCISRCTSYLTLIISIILISLLGVWIW